MALRVVDDAHKCSRLVAFKSVRPSESGDDGSPDLFIDPSNPTEDPKRERPHHRTG